MAKRDLNEHTATEFEERIRRITDASQRQWGALTPVQLLRHLTFMFELSLGEREEKKVFLPMPRTLFWLVFFNWFTNWPKAKIKAPDQFLPEPEGDLEAERDACIAGLRRFVAQVHANPEQTAFNPLLGDIPLRKWARLHGVHMNHHFRQYGV